MQRYVHLLKSFSIPLIILIGTLIAWVLFVYGFESFAYWLALAMTILGSYDLVIEIVTSLMQRKFALDYIALTAIIVAIVTGEVLVGAVIALMLSTGQHLEKYGVAQAKKTLTSLIDRIPNEVHLWQNAAVGEKVSITDVKVGQEIFIRKGEIIPLDGILVSKTGLSDESSLTGEPYLIDKFEGDLIRSGTVNIGQPMVIKVTTEAADSTYSKIMKMVESAQEEKAPLVRLADRYSTIFTLITFGLCAITYFFTQDLVRVLAILVVATPCPLILATPIALLGGMNAAAKKRVIVKKLAALEILSRVDTVIFDKTGTITIGRPELTNIVIHDHRWSEDRILSIAAAIERNSLHPFAKSIVEEAKKKKLPIFHAKNIEEVVGQGIKGTIENEHIYLLRKAHMVEGMAVELLHFDPTPKAQHTLIATFNFSDRIKEDTQETLAYLKKLGMRLLMLTGDKPEAANKVVKNLGLPMEIYAECTPEQKQEKTQELQKTGHKIAMIGDGINDAPALALADVGIVFSNEEQTASSQAADIILLGGDFNLVLTTLFTARRTIRIALQSILWGMGLSITAMLFGAFGLLAPVGGAIIQELIDVVVILNALRTAK